MEGCELFDAGHFRMSHAEVTAMDPQQRLVLEHGYDALRVADLVKADIEGGHTGVSVGIQAFEFSDLLAMSPETVIAILVTIRHARSRYVAKYQSCMV